MSKLNDLIAEFCPNGVECKQLGEIAEIRRGGSFQKKDYVSSGFPCIHYGQIYTSYGLFATKTLNFISNVKAINQRKAVPNDIIMAITSENIEDVCKCVAWLGESEIAVSGHTAIIHHSINAKYLTYYFHSSMFYIQKLKLAHGTKVIEVSPSSLNKIKIPVPPLEVQYEIVRILDSFTELTAELTAELVARKQQYECYRDLLMFDVGSSVELKKLGEVATYGKERIDASNVDFNSYVGVDNLLPDKQGKTISSYVPNEGRLVHFMAGDILIGNIRPYLKKIWFAEYEGGTNGDVLVIRVTADSLSPKFLYYCLSSDKFFHYAVQFSKGAKMPRGDKSATMDFLIPIPSLEEQERIIKILDRFDSLCNDLSEGLPAEIKARQQQYEFYRDKLLSFDKDWR